MSEQVDSPSPRMSPREGSMESVPSRLGKAVAVKSSQLDCREYP